MKKLITSLLIIISLGAYCQQGSTTFSGYFGSDFSAGFEIKKEWHNDWYLAFHAENHRKSDYYFNAGFSIGLVREVGYINTLGSVNALAGARAGIARANTGNKPLIGLEAGIDLNTSDVFFIGIRGSVDRIMDSPDINTPQANTLLTASLKFGLRF